MSSVLSGQMDADGVCLTSAWLPFWILGGPCQGPAASAVHKARLELWSEPDAGTKITVHFDGQ